MSIEQLNSGSGRINKEDLARKMAYAGDKHRTIAAEKRTKAKSLESPKTLKDRIIKLLHGKKAENFAKQFRTSAELHDTVADLKEERTRVGYEIQEETRNLSDAEIEDLFLQARDDIEFTDQQIYDYYDEKERGATLNTDINKLQKRKLVLKTRKEELSKIMARREAIQARMAQERNAKQQ